MQPRPVKKTDPFYLSESWRNLRGFVLRRDRWRCVLCGAKVHAKGASRVDHIKPRRERPDLSLDPANLRTLCTRCDNQRHAEKGRGGETFGANQNGQPLNPNHWWNKCD